MFGPVSGAAESQRHAEGPPAGARRQGRPHRHISSASPDVLEGPSRKEFFAQPPWDTSHLLTKVTSNS